MAEALVSDDAAVTYFRTFPQLLDIRVDAVRRIAPFHFMTVLERMLASREVDFLIHCHGNPAGMVMPLTARAKGDDSKMPEDIRVNRTNLEVLIQAERLDRDMADAGDDTARWRRIVEAIGEKFPSSAFPPTDLENRRRERPQRIAGARELVRRWMEREAERMKIGPNGFRDYIAIMRRVHAKGLRKIEFRACNIGKSPESMRAFRRFFRCRRIGAPDCRSFCGRLFKFVPGRGVIRDFRNKFPGDKIFGPPGRQFAVHIVTHPGNINVDYDNTWVAADNMAAVNAFVSERLMKGATVRSPFVPIHWLELTPPAFPLDPAYRQHIKFSSHLWWVEFPD